MKSQGVGTESAALPQAGEAAEFQFLSSHCAIRARGIFESIRIPVHQNSAGDAHFQRQLRDAFGRARAAGIANPVAIGAIPFDLSQPCQLAIPRRYEVFSRERECRPDADAALPVRLLQRESLPDEARFKQSVRQAIANFQLSDIRKAVLSRILRLELEKKLDLDAFFARLLAQNPSGYHFRLPLADGSELIGASPELLVRRQGERIFSNPLAGSAKRRADSVEDKKVGEGLLQSAKDAYEHRLVIEDIRRQLQPLCEQLEIPDGPQLMSTRAMWHLSTPIEGRLADTSLSALQVACHLHPTPALCGHPTRQAHRLIQLVEPFERGLFGGIVGWCDAEGNGEWAVTIRCGIFSGRRAQLFAGAGIVEDSDPDSEWLETEAKLQTMLAALGVEQHAPRSGPRSAGENAPALAEAQV